MKKIIKLSLTALLFVSSITNRALFALNVEFSKTNTKRDLRGVFVDSVYDLNWCTNRLATPTAQ